MNFLKKSDKLYATYLCIMHNSFAVQSNRRKRHKRSLFPNIFSLLADLGGGIIKTHQRRLLYQIFLESRAGP